MPGEQPLSRAAEPSPCRAVAAWGLVAVALATGAGLTVADQSLAAAALALLAAAALAMAGRALRAADTAARALHPFLQAIATPLARTDADGGELAANAEGAALLRELADAPEVRAARQRALARGSDEIEIECAARDGAKRHWQLEIRRGADSADLLWQWREITAQVARRARIEAALAATRDLLDAVPIGVATMDPDGGGVLANATLLRWLGHDPRAPAPDLPRLAKTALKRLDDHLDDRAPVGIRMLAADGKRVSLGLASAARDERGRLVALLTNPDRPGLPGAVAADLDEQFAGFFAHAPIGVVIVERDGSIDASNPAFRALVGAAPNARVANLVDLLASDDREDLRQRLDAWWHDARTREGLEVRLDPGRGARILQIFGARLDRAIPGREALILHLIDTTEQRNLELQFAQSQKMQAVGQLAGGVAHDFNNLLTAIIGHCDLMLLQAGPGDAQYPDLMQVKQNANRAANLVRQLLAFSRRQTLRPKVLDLSDVLAELTHLIRRLIGESIQLKVTHGSDLGLVKADQGQLEQVIINLAVNARDAMPDGGTLAIRTQNVSEAQSRELGHELLSPGDYVQIEVRDDGKGIAPSDLGKIFEPFFTTKAPGTGAGSGTGLGLSTVYGIVKQTGGYIFPESAVGSGTTFRVFLPRYRISEDQRDVAGQGIESGPQRDLTGKGTILLVEDEDAVRVFAARALRNKGYDVLEAVSGTNALDVIRDHDGDLDLLISDVVMPEMDGPTLIRHVRDMRDNLRVIFISGYAEDAFRRNLDAGSDFAFLPKPFSLTELASKVKDVMAA